MHEVNCNHVSVIIRFFDNPFVSRVKRRVAIRIVRFWRSTGLVFFQGEPLPRVGNLVGLPSLMPRQAGNRAPRNSETDEDDDS